MSRWFRMYDDLLDDPKVQRLEPSLFKTWVNLLCLASKHEGKLPCADDVAFSLRLSNEAVKEAIETLMDKGLIDVVDDEATPHNWHKRQYKSDKDETAAKRQAEKRARDKETSHANVTRDVTDKSQPPETEQNRTEQKELMSEKISDERPKRKQSDYPDQFKTFWLEYPTDPGMSKAEAAKAWEKLSDLDRGHAISAIPAFKIWVGKQGKEYRTLHACRYLTQRRFEGFQNPKSDDGEWAKRLEIARRLNKWDIVNWGPIPGKQGCRVPANLIADGDGVAWAEWRGSDERNAA